MCGRTFCTLDPVCVQKLCQYTINGKTVTPEWKDAPTGEKYTPSCNIGPTIFTPVLLSSKHHDSSMDSHQRTLLPMRWGLIPSWHKGKRTDFKTMHNNCRGETILEKNTFSVPFKKGKRCVVVAEGFYEWKTSGKTKTPFMFVMKDCDVNVKSEGGAPIKSDVKTEFREHKSKLSVKAEDALPEKDIKASDLSEQENTIEKSSSNLLFMAGLFDVFKDEGADLYSYTILTTESEGAVADVHHRMPVILKNPEDIERWLNFDKYRYDEVKNLIKAQDCLKSYQVTDKVNSIKYQESDCCKPLDTEQLKKQAAPGKGDIRNWFNKTPTNTKRKSDVLDDDKQGLTEGKKLK